MSGPSAPLSIPALAIIADDLTGGLDAAAPFAARGATVEAALGAPAIAAALATAPQVLVVCTDSRDLPPDAAARLVGDVVSRLPAGTRLFKKIDSRMKGNVAAELSALRFRRLLVAPAIPEFGRIVTGGAVRGFGVEAPIAIADRLGDHAARAEIPDTPDSAALDRALAESDADLLVGARGLSEALAARMFTGAPRLVTELPGPRALFVIGSRDPITAPQVEALHAAGVEAIAAPNGIAGPAPDAPVLAIHAVQGAETAAAYAVSANLAASVVPRLADGRDTILLTGGATAAAVLARLGISQLRLSGECLPGLPVSHAGGFTFVTKSGGFGSAGTLAEVLRRVAPR